MLLATGLRPRIFILGFLLLTGVVFTIPCAAGELNGTAGAVPEISGDKSFTLKKSVLFALENNPGLKSAEMEIKKAESDIGVARSGFLPSLSASYDYTDLNSLYADGATVDSDYIDQKVGSFNLRATETLFAGLTILNSYQKAKLRKKLAKAQKNSREMELILNVQTHFFRYLKARKDVLSLKDTEKRLKKNIQAAESLFEERMVPYVQVLQAKTDLADARQRLSKAKDEVKKEYDRLNMYLDLTDENPEYVGKLRKNISVVEAGLERCLKTAYENRPEMEMARRSLAVAEKETDITVGRFLPRVNLKGDYSTRNRDYDDPGVSYGREYDRDQHNEYWSVGVQIQWPLFEGGEKGYEYVKAKQEVSRVRHQMVASRNEITSQVRTYYFSLDNAQKRISLTREEIKEAEENYERAEKRYFAELGTQTDLLNAQIRLTRANMNYNQALLDFQVARARLYYAMGIRNYSLEDRTVASAGAGAASSK